MEKCKILITIVFVFSTPIFGQTADEKYANDVKLISAIIDAYYDVISGTSLDPWQFERDKYIHSENAVITKINENGVVQSHSLEAEYIPLLLSPKVDFNEKEIKRDLVTMGILPKYGVLLK